MLISYIGVAFLRLNQDHLQKGVDYSAFRYEIYI
jgi:hypothetical protein